MKHLAEPFGVGRRIALIAGAVTFATLALLAIAARAHASETIYWNNYSASPSSVSFANIDGTAGGALNTVGVEIEDPEGAAYDPANGHIYVASSNNDEIIWVATDGSGSGVLDTTGATVESPKGIAVDPRTQTVYWANEEGDSIGYASADGGGGGALNTMGAEIESPYKIALDTTNGRVYWVNTESGIDGEISYANLDGSGGGNLGLPEAAWATEASAINVDPAAGRLYLLETSSGEEKVRWIDLAGLGGGEVDLAGSSFNDPYGMAFDPSNGRFYWGNYESREEREGAIGTATLTPGGGGGLTIATAPVDGPQDPLVVKSPVGTGAPQVSASGTSLTCSRGSWEPDHPGSYVYAAPLAYAYQWAKDGQAIPGATGPTLTATQSGSYSCTVTATNRSGAASQASPGAAVTIALPVTPAPKPAVLRFKKVVKGAVKVKAGKVAIIKVDLTNSGGTPSAKVKVCGKLTKQAKKGLKAPKCATVKSVPAGRTVVAKLRVKTRKTAKGLYKFPIKVTGAIKGSTVAKVKVLGPKHKKHKANKHSATK